MARTVKPVRIACDHGHASGRPGEDEEMRRRLSAFDKRHFSPQRVAMHGDTTRGRVAIEGAERQRNGRVALVKIFEQGARRVRWLRRKREVGRYRAEQRRRAGGAPQLLEHEDDFAQSDPGGIRTERRKTLPRHGGPQLRNRPRRYRNSPRPCRPAKCSPESPAPICGAGCVRHPTRRLLCFEPFMEAREQRVRAYS